MAAFDIMAGDTVLVERGRRITARHIRQLEDAALNSWRYLMSTVGRRVAKALLILPVVKSYSSAMAS